DGVRGNPDSAERVRMMVESSDRAGKLAWELTADTLLYSAAVAQEIADDIINIDNAMRWGFNWDSGPFETWDSLGVATLAQRMSAEGRTLPPLVRDVLENGVGRFYVDGSYWDFNTHGYRPLPQRAAPVNLGQLTRAGKVIKSNRSASLIDLGDEVLGVEFH